MAARLLLAFQIIICVVLGMATSLAVAFWNPRFDRTAGDPYGTHEYKRFGEVMKECKSFLSWSAAELDFDENKAEALKPELSFAMGDWAQDSGDAPLMPYDGDYPRDNTSEPPRPLQLASFTLKHVDPVRNSRYALNVSGALQVGILGTGAGQDVTQYQFPEFKFRPGDSELRILIEGIYVESKKNGGEKILCLLGDALLPSRQSDSAEPWEWAKRTDSENTRPPLLQDDQILLVLRYPKVFTLTTRAVRGELRSLNKKSSLRYFDNIHVSTQLGPYSSYRFGSEELVSKACNPYPYKNDAVDRRFEVYKETEFCGTLDRFASGGGPMIVVPNWNCNSTDEYCSKLGPFATGGSIRATDGGFANVMLLMQDIRCEPKIAKDKSSSARVSAVFRVVPPWEDQFISNQRTGLNGMTLSAEGIWSSSVGQLCMVGCIGPGYVGCHSRICLYIPRSFSINQRSVIYGRIYSINDTQGILHFPLSFERPMHVEELLNNMVMNTFTYEYSRINLAGAFLERSEPFDFGKMIKKSLLSYPTKGNDSDDMINLSRLADDLTLRAPLVPDFLSKKDRTKIPFLQMEVLSLGSLLGRYWGYRDTIAPNYETLPSAKAIVSEEKLLLNVSADFTLSGVLDSNVSRLYLEGLYNPVDGIMYLLGCRDVRASWKVLFESMDLEDGLDCLIEAKVEYPPTTARWLMNPTAKVSITSRRNDDDPLHFNAVKLQTLPILYHGQRDDIMSRRGVEGILRILTLSLAIIFILGQLSYIRDNNNVVPYISLVMLGVQALGFSIPLVVGVEALFARTKSESYGSTPLEFEKNHWFQVINYLVKALVLAALLLTLRLGQKVWKSRIRLLARTPLEPGRVPNDRRVLLISFGLHLIGFFVILIVHLVSTSKRPIQEDKYLDSHGNRHYMHEWTSQLEEYIGLIQDFFLLPQVIGNILWATSCKPLRKTYYVGITVVRIIPHIYDFLRTPVFNPYFSEQYGFVNPSLDYYSKFGDIAIPIIAALLVLVVYVQQRWNFEKLNQTVRLGHKRLLPFGSRVYERLPSVSFEAELATGVNAAGTQGEPQKDEER